MAPGPAPPAYPAKAASFSLINSLFSFNRIIGIRAAEKMKFEYNSEEDKNMTKYLKEVRKLPKDAKGIIG
jgi:hypothetical protein